MKTIYSAFSFLFLLLFSACHGLTDITAHYSVTSSTSKDHLKVIVDGIARGQVSGGYGYFDAPLAVPTQSSTGPSPSELSVGVSVAIHNIERNKMSASTQCYAGGKIVTRITYEITQYHPEGELTCISW